MTALRNTVAALLRQHGIIAERQEARMANHTGMDAARMFGDPDPVREPTFTPARAWLDRHPTPSDDVARIARSVIRDTKGDPARIARWMAALNHAIDVEKRHAAETADRARKGGAL
jgi:hypothetical protein